MSAAMHTASASVSLIAGLLALSASHASAESAATRVIKCEASFGRNASHANLVKAFGKNNVVYREIEGPQDKKTKASILYPDHPKARLEFVWRDERARRRPALIKVKDQSAWAAANGMRIGAALADIEKMNGKPFRLSGFDWDYGGRVTDWRGGALGKPQPGACTLGIEFVHPEDAPEENLTKVSGDREILSDDADMRAVEPYVAVMTFSYPKR
jgi:hypothetical protein